MRGLAGGLAAVIIPTAPVLVIAGRLLQIASPSAGNDNLCRHCEAGGRGKRNDGEGAVAGFNCSRRHCCCAGPSLSLQAARAASVAAQCSGLLALRQSGGGIRSSRHRRLSALFLSWQVSRALRRASQRVGSRALLQSAAPTPPWPPAWAAVGKAIRVVARPPSITARYCCMLVSDAVRPVSDAQLMTIIYGIWIVSAVLCYSAAIDFA